MRFIGGHDYYDGVQGLGYDASVAFVRPKDMTLDAEAAKAFGFRTVAHPFSFPRADEKPAGRWSRPSGDTHTFRADGVTHSFSGVTAYVCGKRYAGVEVESADSYPFPRAPGTYGTRSRFFWDWEGLLAHAASLGRVPAPFRPVYGEEARARDPSAYFAHGPVSRDLMDRLVSNRVTIATCRHRAAGPEVWRINGDDLGSIQFFRSMEPFAMFQEVEMWVSGVLPAGANPMVVITDDKVKIAKAGFDTVTSFRKGKAA